MIAYFGVGGNVNIDGGMDGIGGAGKGTINVGTGPTTNNDDGVNVGAVGRNTFVHGNSYTEGRYHKSHTFVPVLPGDTYTMLDIDEIVQVDTQPVACQVQMPPAPAADGKTVTIIDIRGNAAANPITLIPNGAEMIQGGPSYVMGVNRESITLVSGPLGWCII